MSEWQNIGVLRCELQWLEALKASKIEPSPQLPERRDHSMLTFKAAYQFVEGGVHAHVVDFPGAITCGQDLPETRRRQADAVSKSIRTETVQTRATWAQRT